MGKSCIESIQNKWLILGIGNLLLRDEGAGIHVVYRLEREHFREADLLDGGTGGFHLLGILGSYEKVIIADASLDDLPAGTVRLLKPTYARDFPKQLSAHEIGLKDLLDALFLLGDKPDIYLITISVKDYQELGMELSSEVEEAIPLAIEKIKEVLNNTTPAGLHEPAGKSLGM
jgi:hydrogenase maturation protease